MLIGSIHVICSVIHKDVMSSGRKVKFHFESVCFSERTEDIFPSSHRFTVQNVMFYYFSEVFRFRLMAVNIRSGLRENQPVSCSLFERSDEEAKQTLHDKQLDCSAMEG